MSETSEIEKKKIEAYDRMREINVDVAKVREKQAELAKLEADIAKADKQDADA